MKKCVKSIRTNFFFLHFLQSSTRNLPSTSAISEWYELESFRSEHISDLFRGYLHQSMGSSVSPTHPTRQYFLKQFSTKFQRPPQNGEIEGILWLDRSRNPSQMESQRFNDPCIHSQRRSSHLGYSGNSNKTLAWRYIRKKKSWFYFTFFFCIESCQSCDIHYSSHGNDLRVRLELYWSKWIGHL